MTIKAKVRPVSASLLAVLLVTAACGGSDDSGDGGTPADQAADTAAEAAAAGGAGPALAEGDTKGNGGDAVVCFADPTVRETVRQRLLDNRYSPTPVNPFEQPAVMAAISSLEIFDLYEYRLPTGLPPQQPRVIQVQEPFLNVLPRIIDRLGAKSGLAGLIRNAQGAIPVANWKAAPGVVEIDDSAHAIILPSACLLVQVAVRQEGFVFYDAILFERLDELNRLALMLHELTYKVAADAGQSNSRQARVAVGLMLSESELDTLSPFALHKRLNGLGNFGFVHDFGHGPRWIAKVFEESADGRPLAFDLAGPETFGLGGADFTAVPRGNNQPGVRLAADGTLAELYAALATPALRTERPGLLKFTGDRLVSAAWPGNICVPELKWLGETFRYVSEVQVGADGQVTRMRMSESGCGSSGQIPTKYGAMSAYGWLDFHPGTQVPVRTFTGGFSPRLIYGYLGISGAVTFHANGELASVENAWVGQSTGSSSISVYQLPTGIGIYMSSTGMSFNDDGTVAAVDMRLANEHSHRLNWAPGSFEDVLTVTMHSGNRLARVELGHMGRICHKELAPQCKNVGPLVVEIDEDGKVLTPF